jgi:hypothetical protein
MRRRGTGANLASILKEPPASDMTTFIIRRFNTVGPLRRAMVSKLFAALLVVLAISPFTAPFPTFDLAEFSGNITVHQGNLSADKMAKDKSTAHVMVPLVDPSSTGVVLEAARCFAHTDGPRTFLIALRI